MADLRSAILETHIKDLYDEDTIVKFIKNSFGTEIKCQIEFSNIDDKIRWILSNKLTDSDLYHMMQI
jgi:hypothetical protein